MRLSLKLLTGLRLCIDWYEIFAVYCHVRHESSSILELPLPITFYPHRDALKVLHEQDRSVLSQHPQVQIYLSRISTNETQAILYPIFLAIFVNKKVFTFAPETTTSVPGNKLAWLTRQDGSRKTETTDDFHDEKLRGTWRVRKVYRKGGYTRVSSQAYPNGSRTFAPDVKWWSAEAQPHSTTNPW